MNEDLLNVMGSFSETALDCIEKQNEEIEDLKKENARLKDKMKELQQRIDKAIEYIENDLQSFLYSIEYKTLLEILKGGNK